MTQHSVERFRDQCSSYDPARFSEQLQAFTVPENKPKGRRITALKITLYHRPESRNWQARIHVFGKPVVRISTGTENKHAALEAAELAYRHFARKGRKQS